MRKLFVSIMIVAIVGFSSSLIAEDLPPISLGGGQSSTQQANGQVIEISISGSVQATVYFDKVQPDKVSGLTVRTSAGTTSGSVTIRWVNTNRQVTLNLSATIIMETNSLRKLFGEQSIDGELGKGCG